MTTASAPGGRLQLGGAGADQGVHDRVQRGELLRVGEDDRAQLRAGPGCRPAASTSCAEGLDDGREPGGARARRPRARSGRRRSARRRTRRAAATPRSCRRRSRRSGPPSAWSAAYGSCRDARRSPSGRWPGGSAVALPLGQEPLELAADLVRGRHVDRLGDACCPGSRRPATASYWCSRPCDEGDQLLVALAGSAGRSRSGCGAPRCAGRARRAGRTRPVAAVIASSDGQRRVRVGGAGDVVRDVRGDAQDVVAGLHRAGTRRGTRRCRAPGPRRRGCGGPASGRCGCRAG